MRKALIKIWNWISHVNTGWSILQYFGVQSGTVAGAVSSLLTWVETESPSKMLLVGALVFVSVSLGINQLVQLLWRLSRRHAPNKFVKSQSSNGTQSNARSQGEHQNFDELGESGWIMCAPVPVASFRSAGVVVNDRFYLVGGRNRRATLNSFFCYHFESNWWEELPPMRTARHSFCCAYANNGIYVFGGASSVGEQLSTVEFYGIEDREWIEMPNMPTARDLHTCAYLNGKVYIFGGSPNSESLRKVEIYDPFRNGWLDSELFDPVRRHGHSASVVAGEVFLIDGTDSREAVNEKFVPTTETWSRLRDAPEKRVLHSAASTQKTVYVAGGIASSDASEAVLEYNIEANSWKFDPPMPHGRESCLAAVHSGTLYVFGGADNRGAVFDSVIRRRL